MIGGLYVEQFTDPDALWPLGGYVENLQLRRELSILNDQKLPLSVQMIGVNCDMAVEHYELLADVLPGDDNVTGRGAQDQLVQIYYTDERYTDVLQQGRSYCIVSEDVMEWSGSSIIYACIYQQRGEHVVQSYRIGLEITGIVKSMPDRPVVFLNEEELSRFFRSAGLHRSP